MKRSLLGCLLALGFSAPLSALPTDPTTVHGQVQIQNGQNLVQILQQTPQAIINWGQFNIGLGETVRFLQPSQQAAILNRVTGLDPSLIQGVLQANGRVFLLNPNGILFGPNSVVDVGSFTASTLKMSDEDFLNGTYKLTQDRALPLAALTNQGTIKVAEGGFVVLVSPLLDNQGMILAQAGQVNLGASTQATFSVDGRGLVQFVVPDGFDPQFRGGGQGGSVLLQPGQMSELLSQVVTNPALVEAGSFHSSGNGQTLAQGAEGVLLNSGTIQAEGGVVRLDSSQASVLSSGGKLEGGEVRLLSAGSTVSSGQIKADFAEVSGKNLWVQGPIQANSILFDPFDITIIDGGPNTGTFDGGLPNPTNPGSGSVSVASMQAQAGTVTLNADHDVIYNGGGFSLGATALTVIAGNDINFTISNSISAAALNLQAGHDVLMSIGNGGLASNGALSVVGAHDVRITANADLIFSSPTLVQITATNNDLALTSALVNTNFTTFLNGGGAYEFSAGHDLTLTQPRLSAGASAVSAVAGNDLTLQQGNGTFFTGQAGSLSFQAGRNFSGTTLGDLALSTSSGGDLQIIAQGNLNLSAANNLGLASAGTLIVRGATVTGAGVSTSLTAAGQTVVNATGGDLSLRASNNDLTVSSSAGRTAVNATGDLTLVAGGDLRLGSATTTRITAGNDATLTSANVSSNFTTFITGPDTAVSAGHDLTMNQPNLRHNGGGGAVALSAANDLRMTSPNNQIIIDVVGLQVQAGRDLVGQPATGSLNMHTANDLTLSAGRNLTLTAPNGGISLASDTGAARLTAQDVRLIGRDVSVSSQGEAVINATNGSFIASGSQGDTNFRSSGGRLAVNATGGDVGVTAGGDIRFQSASTTTVNSTRDVNLTASTAQTAFSTFLGSPSTSIAAGRNLTISSPNIGHQGGAGPVTLNAANDLTLTSSNFVSLNLNALNAQAGRDILISPPTGAASLVASNGDLSLGAARNLQVSAPGQGVSLSASGALNVTAQNVSSTGRSQNFSGSGPVVINATNGSVALAASASDIILHSNDRLAVNATNGDVSMTAGGDIKLESGTTTAINATGDVNLTSATVLTGFSTFLSSPNTSIAAGRNLTLNQPNLNQQSGSGHVDLSAVNDVLFVAPYGSLDSNLGGLNVTAGRDILGQSSTSVFNLNSGRELNLQAGRNLGLSANGSMSLISAASQPVNLTAGNIDLSGNGLRVLSSGSNSIKASNGGIKMTAGGNTDLTISGTTVSVNATNGDVEMAAGGDIRLQSSNNSVNATQDVKMSSALVNTNFTTFLVGPTTLQAGRDLNLSQPNLNQSGGALVLKAGNDLVLRNDTGSLNAPLQSLDAQAGGDLRIQTNTGFSLQTNQGLSLIGAGNVSFTSGSLQNSSGATTISGGNVALTNVGLTANNGDTNLLSSGNLTVGSLNTNATINTTLSGANITLQSMQLISGGNYTITTPGNLTELTPATNPPTLAALNITAGNAFGPNAVNASFSVPRTASAGNLTGLITGGNDTLQHASSSFRNFNGANFQPGHIDFQTGDIYVDGLLFYSGLPPIVPPPDPPTPPPVPNPPVVTVSPAVASAVAAQQQSGITSEQRTQILAQSNLALGNLGSFSRELSGAELEHLTARQDSIHQTWPLDPFSPTLALTVPGGPPQVYASELANLAAMLLNSANPNEVEEKTRGAYNVIVDQELREIWEVRYWRHLLEGFIIWEDRE